MSAGTSKAMLLLAIVILFLPIITSAYTGTQPQGKDINCFRNSDCPYGYTCPSTGQLAQCQSISGQEFLVCANNGECTSGQTCAKTPPPQPNQLGTCQSCQELWSFRTTDSCYDDFNDCGTQYDLRKNAGNYPVCQAQQQEQQCQEDWVCGQWVCFNEQITRGCTDINNCGTTNNKPAIESGTCTSTDEGKKFNDNELQDYLKQTEQFQELANLTKSNIIIQQLQVNWPLIILGLIIIFIIRKGKII